MGSKGPGVLEKSGTAAARRHSLDMHICVTGMDFDKQLSPEATDIDDQLLDRFVRSGDREAMAEVFRRHVDCAYRIARRSLGCDADVEDVVQSAFMQVLAKAGTYRAGSDLRAWIVTITLNQCRQYHRTRTRRQRREQEFSRQPQYPADEESTSDVNGLLRHALAALPEKFRMALCLHYI
jgi:RNA polymerase sigma factor (sigma-70 family)